MHQSGIGASSPSCAKPRNGLLSWLRKKGGNRMTISSPEHSMSEIIARLARLLAQVAVRLAGDPAKHDDVTPDSTSDVQ